MKFEVSIDSSYKEPKIIILTDKMTDEISDMIKRLSETYSDILAVFSDRGVEIVEWKDMLIKSLLWVVGYTIMIFIIAVLNFRKKIKS